MDYNCYIKCLNYNLDKTLNKYECNELGFNLFKELSNQTKNEMIDSFDILIQNKNPNNSYIINGDNYTIFINPLGRFISDSNVNIDFSECEKILKNKYPNFEYRILQINSNNKNPNCLNEDVEYRVYNQFGAKIDLSCCKNVKITIQNKINFEDLDLEKILKFKNMGIDIFQLDNDFFNDIPLISKLNKRPSMKFIMLSFF